MSTGNTDAITYVIINTIIPCLTIFLSTRYAVIAVSGDQIHRLFEITKNFFGLK